MTGNDNILVRRLPNWWLLLLLGGLIAFFYLSCDLALCGNEVEFEHVSPDGRRRAVLFERGCGATTGFSTHLSILAASSKLRNESGNVFTADLDRADTLPFFGPLATITWISPDTLEVRHSQRVHFYVANHQWDGVVVRYVPTTTPGLSGGRPAVVVSDSALRNGTYAPAVLRGRHITLRDGDWESPDRSATASLSRWVTGDLTGDGVPEAAVILLTNPGATGRFFDLIPVRSSASGIVAGRPTTLGDRILVDSLWIAGERAHIRLVTQGPHEGLCCPTQREHRIYRLVGDSLRAESVQVLPPRQ